MNVDGDTARRLTGGTIRQALEAAVADGFLAEKPKVIRIERE
jgi:hypothetical protein